MNWHRHVSIAFAFVIACFPPALAHDEPPKTQSEKLEFESRRLEMESLGVKAQSLYRVELDSITNLPDTSLLILNEYLPNGNLIIQFYFDGAETTQTVFWYDALNNWLGEASYNSGILLDSTVFIYDKSRLIERIDDYDSLGQLSASLIYRKFSSGDSILIDKHSNRDSLLYRIVYYYEPHTNFGQNLEAYQWDTNNSLIVHIKNKFDSDLRTEKAVYDKNDSLSFKFGYEYTAAKKISRIIRSNPSGEIVSVQTLHYDSIGLLGESKTPRASGETVMTLFYRYVYYK